MNINELQSGDVLLFSPEKGSWLSEAIVFLTGADVSHTAMTYQQYSDIIEETPPAIRVAKAKERFPGRTIHVMRDERQQDFEPVMQAAAKYLNDEEPYGMTNLYLVGMLLIYKKFTPSGPQQRATLAILKKLTAKLIKLINEHKYPGKLPMVCSQYIFQAYQDAGENYQLTIKNGDLLKAKTAATNSSLFDKALQHSSAKLDNNPQTEKLMATPDSEYSDDKILEDLKSLEGVALDSLESEILDHVQFISKALHAIENKLDLNDASHQSGFKLMQKQNAIFVTPADLLEHCPELTKIGEIKI